MLETQIGRDLFTRTSRGIIPTAAAHELARSSGPHIDALELLGETAQISDYEGTVHLGGPIEFLTERVLPSLSQLIRNGLGFRVTVASPEKLIDQLSKHTIDLAVTVPSAFPASCGPSRLAERIRWWDYPTKGSSVDR